MEHSVLHALDLIGQVIALGGVLMVLGLIRPALRTVATDAGSGELSRALSESAAQWMCRGALLAAAATFVGLFVDVAEVKGKTVFDGVNLGLAFRFATQTRVGQFSHQPGESCGGAANRPLNIDHDAGGAYRGGGDLGGSADPSAGGAFVDSRAHRQRGHPVAGGNCETVFADCAVGHFDAGAVGRVD